jgi:hypothetical protein
MGCLRQRTIRASRHRCVFIRSRLPCRNFARFDCTKSGPARDRTSLARRPGPGGVAVGRRPVGRGTGGPVGRPGSAVDRSRRESVDRHPGRTRTAGTTVYRPNPGVDPTVTSDRLRAERPWVRRTASPNNSTAFVRTARPASRAIPAAQSPTTGMRARHCTTGFGKSTAPPPAGKTEYKLRRRVRPSPTPFGREHTTPIVQTRGGASSPLRQATTDSSTYMSSVACFAAFEPGSFGGPRRVCRPGPRTVGMARLQDIRRTTRTLARARLSHADASGNGAEIVPLSIPALGPTTRTCSPRRRPVPASSLSLRRKQVHREMAHARRALRHAVRHAFPREERTPRT